MSELQDFIQGIEDSLETTEEVVDVKEDEGKPSVPDTKDESEKGESVEKTEELKEEESKKEESKTVPLKALEEERHKRQELQRQIDELKASMSSKKTEEEEKIDLLEEPEKWTSSVEKKFEMKFLINKIEMSEELVKSQYEDYDEKVERFTKEAQSDPSLISRMNSASNPALFAYNTGKKFLSMDEFDNIEAYKQSLSEQLRKEIEEEYKSKYEVKNKKADKLPTSITDKSSLAESDKEEEIDVDDFLKKTFGSN